MDETCAECAIIARSQADHGWFYRSYSVGARCVPKNRIDQLEIVVSPRRHVDSLEKLTRDEACDLGRLVRLATRSLGELYPIVRTSCLVEADGCGHIRAITTVDFENGNALPEADELVAQLDRAAFLLAL